MAKMSVARELPEGQIFIKDAREGSIVETVATEREATFLHASSGMAHVRIHTTTTRTFIANGEEVEITSRGKVTHWSPWTIVRAKDATKRQST